MPQPTRYAEMCKEAICSALYSLEWSRFLGERPDVVNGWDVAYFRLSRDPAVEVSARSDPKQIMVEVRNDTEEVVSVTISWLNMTAGTDNPIRGEQTIRIVANPDQDDHVRLASERALVRVLEIWSDVMQETGVAGALEANAPDTAYEGVDDETDLARTDEEVGRE